MDSATPMKNGYAAENKTLQGYVYGQLSFLGVS